ncbi:hypothetical protein CAI21_22495, partial [Alkalilimnicola ehrlichii]
DRGEGKRKMRVPAEAKGLGAEAEPKGSALFNKTNQITCVGACVEVSDGVRENRGKQPQSSL